MTERRRGAVATSLEGCGPNVEMMMGRLSLTKNAGLSKLRLEGECDNDRSDDLGPGYFDAIFGFTLSVVDGHEAVACLKLEKHKQPPALLEGTQRGERACGRLG